MERVADTWQEIEVLPREFRVVGDEVVGTSEVRLTGHDGGVPVDQRGALVYTLREGKVAASLAYPTEAALDALGLGD
jgi:ketosteroid isomerase-like protein